MEAESMYPRLILGILLQLSEREDCRLPLAIITFLVRYRCCHGCLFCSGYAFSWLDICCCGGRSGNSTIVVRWCSLVFSWCLASPFSVRLDHHSHISLTPGIYSPALPSMQKKAMNRLDDLFKEEKRRKNS